MINSSLEAQEKVEALIIYKFLVLYNDFENCVRDVFSKEWNSMDSAIKIELLIMWDFLDVRQNI